MNNSGNVLFFIVGTGKNDSQNYLDILKKSVEGAEADNIVLLASAKSLNNAQCMKNYYDDSCEVKIALLDTEAEFDADKCFEFFEKQIKEVLENGITSNNLVIDFTHGTKPMSAALYALGMRYHIYNFQYVVRRQDADGNFTGEEVKYFDAAYVKYLDLIEQCGSLFENWQFAAVNTLLASFGKRSKPKTNIERIGMLATFYSAWDRLDYKTACKFFPSFTPITLEKLGRFLPPAKIENILEILAEGLKEPQNGRYLSDDDANKNKKFLKNLLFDLYANALRRIDEEKLEDAGIRIYKMVETLVQLYLLDVDKYYISGCMPCDDDDFRNFAEKNKVDLSKKTIILERKKAIDFLDFLGYNHEKISFLNTIENDIKLRNKSILIHGYEAKVSDKEQLKELLDRIINRLRPEICDGDFDEIKDAALFMNGFKDCN